MPRLVVFDMDGTLLDSISGYTQALFDYSEQNGLPRPCVATILSGYGDPHNHDFKWGLPREEQLYHLQQSFQAFDARVAAGDLDVMPPLFEGVAETLESLHRRGHELAIITSKSSAPLFKVLAHHGVADYFSSIRTRCDIAARGEAEKPAPDQLRSVMRERGASPEDTVMIGDTVMDIKMGRAAGSVTVGVTWGLHGRADLQAVGAHHIAESHISRVLDILHPA